MLNLDRGFDENRAADCARRARCGDGALQFASWRRRVAVCDSSMRAGRPVTLEVVGLLENSVLQGNLLVSEENFLRVVSGRGWLSLFLDRAYRSKMPTTAVDGMRSMPATLESALAEEGFESVDAREELAQFLAVQNTYLSTFQSLGALGLLLGTIGLAVVQLRSVLERRGELALMRAGGFNRVRLDADGDSARTPCCLWAGWSSAVLRRRLRSFRNGCRRGRACRGLRWRCCWARSRSWDCWPDGWRRVRRCGRRLLPALRGD